MKNQEGEAAKKGEELFWRKCPICGQEFKDFLPLIKHMEEHLRRESQMVKIELGAKDYLAKRIAQEFSPFTQVTNSDRKQGPRQPRASKRILHGRPRTRWLKRIGQTSRCPTTRPPRR